MQRGRFGWIQRGFAVALLCAAVGCGDDDGDGDDTTATGGKGGDSGRAGAGTSGQSSGGRGGTGGRSAGRGGSTSGTGGTAPMQSCTEQPNANLKCGGETCVAPTFANNPCVIPCCINVGGQERCGAKSASAMFPTECALPAVEDPSCPDVDDGMGGALQGCCNPTQSKCGIVSSLRPGCITESMIIELPKEPQACTPDMGGADAGVEDAGR